MESEFANLNWAAVFLGTVLAFGLGMLWFSPRMFGKAWAEGSHNLQPPSSPPIGAMIIQLCGTFLMALIIGLTETQNMLVSAIVAILAITFIVAGMGLFSQKSGKAVLIDASFVVAMGILMILFCSFGACSISISYYHKVVFGDDYFWFSYSLLGSYEWCSMCCGDDSICDSNYINP